jgi:hypothetical protein
VLDEPLRARTDIGANPHIETISSGLRPGVARPEEARFNRAEHAIMP